MRIIGGYFKGVKILEAFDKSTRPLKDLVKESILNILQHSKNEKINFDNSTVLDLFSGTGSFGLECISRGSSKVYFFERYKQSLEILKKNVKKLKCEKKVKIYNNDAHNFFLDREVVNEKFDLIFLDPPFREKKIEIILQNIAKIKILNKNGMIVVHRHKKTKDEFGKVFKLKRTVKYGISQIIFGKIN